MVGSQFLQIHSEMKMVDYVNFRKLTFKMPSSPSVLTLNNSKVLSSHN